MRDGSPSAAPDAVPRPSSGATIDVRVRVSIVPGADARFVSAVARAWQRVSLCDEVETASPAGARLAESILHESGFPRARVLDGRSLDEAYAHLAHWRVRRDGVEDGATYAEAIDSLRGHSRGTQPARRGLSARSVDPVGARSRALTYTRQAPT